MKVIYKKTIVQQVEEASRRASMLDRIIDHIELTTPELQQLVKELKLPPFFCYNGSVINQVMGIDIKVVDEKTDKKV